MQSLARSFTCHLLAPFAVHLVLALLLVWTLPWGAMMGFLLFGGYITLLGIALISIPFGVVHGLQVIRFARNKVRPRDQFLIGLLNPSFASLTIAVLFHLAPHRFL
jgi:hypothetical protein